MSYRYNPYRITSGGIKEKAHTLRRDVGQVEECLVYRYDSTPAARSL
jgi:hypothetical protein